MTPQDDHLQEKPKLTWLWMMLALAVAGISLWALWYWQHSRPAFAGVCAPADVSLSIGATEGTAGTEYVHVVLTNDSDHICTLRGYPIVSVLDAHGENRVTSDAQHNEIYPATTVRLGPRDHAHAVVGFPDAGNFEPGTCLNSAATLRLYLPADVVMPGTTALTTPSSRPACPGLSVTTLQAGL